MTYSLSKRINSEQRITAVSKNCACAGLTGTRVFLSLFLRAIRDDVDDLVSRNSPFHHFIYFFVKVVLMLADHICLGLCDGMFRHKDRAAVLIGENRCFIGPDLLGYMDDLFLVETDQGTEYRERADLVGNCKSCQSLGSNLSDALSCDQAQAVVFFCQPLSSSCGHFS